MSHQPSFEPATEQRPQVHPFFDKTTNTVSYVVVDPDSTVCAVLDAVMEFDFSAGKLTTLQADDIINFIEKSGLQLDWIIETHVHADHLSAAPYIQEKLGGKIAIGEHITTVQDTFGKVFNEGTEFQRDGSQFDRLFKDGDTYSIGNLSCATYHTPGHTPACMAHIIGDAIFVGDTLFMPDGGSARCDFPGGDAGILYDSIQRILSLPEKMRLFVCHDYGPNGREFAWETTVAEQKRNNIHVKDGISKEEFVEMRSNRDKQLAMPTLIIPSLQVNMRAGEVPQDQDGHMTLKIPVNKL